MDIYGLSQCVRSIISQLLTRDLYRSMKLSGLTGQANPDFRGTFYATWSAPGTPVRAEKLGSFVPGMRLSSSNDRCGAQQ